MEREIFYIKNKKDFDNFYKYFKVENYMDIIYMHEFVYFDEKYKSEPLYDIYIEIDHKKIISNVIDFEKSEMVDMNNEIRKLKLKKIND